MFATTALLTATTEGSCFTLGVSRFANGLTAITSGTHPRGGAGGGEAKGSDAVAELGQDAYDEVDEEE